MVKVSVACGGTGGHIFPGLATAQALNSRGHQVTLWLAGKTIEQATRGVWEGPVVTIPAQGFPLNPVRLVRSLLVLRHAYRTACDHMRRSRPDALLAMGSYASTAPVLAARRLRVPIVLHEANVIPGRAIGFLARYADALGVAFDETRQHLAHPRVTLTGMPIRKELEAAAAASPAPDPQAFTVLVMGGSQGAHALNETAVQALAGLRAQGFRARVIHLAGTRDEPAIAEAYRRANVPATVYGFLNDMGLAYRQASVAISRSGAASCAELALFGIPALLVPYPHAARNHQAANARAMAGAGAAVVVEQKDLIPTRVAEFLKSCHDQPDRLQRMRAAAQARAIPGADARLADLVERVGQHSL